VRNFFLNSKSARYPQGPRQRQRGSSANTIMDFRRHLGRRPNPRRWRILPPHNEDGGGPDRTCIIPWWLYQEQLAGESSVRPPRLPRRIQRLRGPMPGGRKPALRRTSRAAALRDQVQRERGPALLPGSFVGYTCRGEMIANEDSFRPELDPRGERTSGASPCLRWHLEMEVSRRLRMADQRRAELHRRSSKRWAEKSALAKAHWVATAIGRGAGKVIHEVGGSAEWVDGRRASPFATVGTRPGR